MSTALVPRVQGTEVEMEDQLDDDSQMSSLSSLPSKNPIDEEVENTKSDDEHQTSKTGIDEACLLVKAILEQVTLNDSPPVNDEIPPPSPAVTPKRRMSPRMSPRKVISSKASISTKTTSSSTNRFTRQRHVWQQLDDVASPTNSSKSSEHGHCYSPSGFEHVSPPVQLPIPPIDGHSIEATSTMSTHRTEMETDPGALWMAHYRKSQTRSEMKMGNVALATLCSRTLDSIANLDEGVKNATRTDGEPKKNAEAAARDEATPRVANNIVKDAATHSKDMSKEMVVLENISAPNSPSKSKPGNNSVKKGWFSKRLRKKKQQPETPDQQNECHIIEDISDMEIQADLNKMALSSNADGDSPLRELDNLPPTPIRTNTTRPSKDSSEGADENVDMSKFQDDDDISLDAIEKMRSEDSDDDNVEADDDEEEEEDDDVELTEIVDHDILEDQDLVLQARSKDELFPASPTSDMEHIQEETAAEIAEEENGKPEEEQNGSRPIRKPSPLKVSTRPPTGKPPATSPQGRIQMFGSEYARFLSSTPFSPEITRARSGIGRSALHRSGRTTKANSFSSAARSVNIEEAKDAIVTGAITDIIVTYGNDMPPKGYYRISQTGSGEDFTALRTSGVSKVRKSTPVYLNVKKEPSWDKAAQRPCVTALALIFPDRKEFVPPGFCVVRRYKGSASTETLNPSNKEGTLPANLNHGSSGERVYLCYRRSREGNPITGIIPLQPSKGEAIPEGYTVLERSPRNFVADVNAKAGVPVFLAFRQRLANLETLRPLPLVLSIHYSNIVGSEDGDPVRLDSGKKRLSAYYCTGGTVVPSDVGRFHIMDRSTHSLLSPSSVSNRISLIEASRKHHSSVDCSDIPKSMSSSTYASSVGVESTRSGRGYCSTPSISVSDVGLTGDGSVLSNASSSLIGIINGAVGMNPIKIPKHHSRDRSLSSLSDVTLMDGTEELNTSSQTAAETDSMGASAHPSIFSHEEIALQSCFDAMDFIPVIEDKGVPADAADLASRVEVLQSRVAVLTPILTACYTHHGGSALVAVEGLTKLLIKTDFFEPDVADFENGTSSRLTLLDIAIQSVCDVATSSSRETNFSPCVEFVESAIRYSRGHLNTRTIGYAIRFYLFVFYFGASVPTASSSWPMARKENRQTGTHSYVMNDVSLLHEEGDELDADAPRPFYPGGAPQASALGLKELMSLTLVRLRDASSSEREMLATIGQEIVAYMGGQSNTSNPFNGFIQNILSSLVDGAVHRVDLANYTQLALHQMHRSGGSELFWHDMMNACGEGLFGQDSALGAEGQKVYIMSFAILANLVKVSSTKLRRVSRTREFVPRDLASKLLCMELLHHFLEQWGQEQSIISEDQSSTKALQSVDTMAYSIRRLVVPCLLWNTESGLENNRVFRRIIRLVSGLWCTPCYRSKMKMELGVLIEHFVMRVLQLGPQLLPVQELMELDSIGGSNATTSAQQNEITQSLLQHQMEILAELKRWFRAGSNGVVELFLNFDQDFSPGGDGPTTRLMPGPQWKICQQLCAAICAIAEQSSETIAEQIRISQNTGAGPPSPRALSPENGIEMASVREGGRLLQRKSFDAITHIVKSLAESAAFASGKRYKRLLQSWTASGEDLDHDETESILTDDDESLVTADDVLLPSPRSRVLGIRRRELFVPLAEIVTSPRSRSLSPKRGNEIVDYWQNSIAVERKKANLASPRGRSVSPVRLRQTPAAEPILRLPSTCPEPRIEKLLAIEADITKTKKTEAETVESKTDHPSTEETLDVAFKLVREKNLKTALEYLVACNFLTPSARDIASFLRIHSSRIDASTLGRYLGEGGKDGAEIEYRNLVRFNYVRAISFVGMNVEEGLRYFLTHCGFRLPGEAQMIDRIITTFSQCFWEDNAGDIQRCPFKDQDTVFLISFAIIMLNTDLHKVQHPSGMGSRMQRKKMTKPEFLKNLQGVDNDEELSHDYLSSIYDSIEANPIAIMDESNLGGLPKTLVGIGNGSKDKAPTLDSNSLLKTMLQSVRPSEELLRGLSVHENPFYTVEDFCNCAGESEQNALRNLVRKAFSTTWYLFHGVINAILDNAHLDAQGMDYCLDVLKYAICATICLDMTMERSAFVTQLARFKIFTERRGEWFATRSLSAYKLEDWYIELEMDCADPLDEKAKLSALEQVHYLFEELHSTLKVDSCVKKDMHRVVRQIRNGGFLLNDPARSFVKEGDLMKRANRSGRTVMYRFFLFSDVLMYAKATHENDYKVHEELPLFLMKVVDFFPPSGKKHLKRSFEIHHPRKSFLVIAGSIEEKKDWVATLRSAIEKDIDRKARLESARLTSSMHQWDGQRLCFG